MEVIQELIYAGEFSNVSAFLLAVVMEKLETCSAGACRAVDERAERHEIKDYFKTKGEAYPSDACLDLGLGYDQICRAIEDLNSEVMLGDT